MKNKALFICIITVMIALVTAIVCAVVLKVNDSNDRVLNAKVRYFDGECEMIELDSFSVCSDALVRLVTKAGDVMYIGPNNVMILNEEAGT